MDQNAEILAETNGKKNGVGIDVRLTGDLTMKGGSIISAITRGSSSGGNIDMAVQGDMTMKEGSAINASTSGNGTAGNILVTANNLSIDGYEQVTSSGQTSYFPTGIQSSAGSPGKNEKTGNAGNITVDIANRLSLTRGAQVDSVTFSRADAGNVRIKAGQLAIDGQGAPLGTGISTNALNSWSGKGGYIDIDVQRDMAMKDRSSIVAISAGEGAAGNIKVSAGNLSLKQNSFISTESVSGNGGDITIQRSELIQLINSGFKTSVSGRQGGNGGNITVNGKILVMETGLIQANTQALGASGGNISLNLNALIPSGGTLIQGGDQPITWDANKFGFNVIQAAAPNGISGRIQSTAPQLDLSGVLGNLGGPQFDTRAISQDYCSLGTGSSLIRQGKGGLPLRSRDSVLY